jgi:hypothetical protein
MAQPRNPRPRKVRRDATTGRFTSKAYVQQHPDTAVEEIIVVAKPKKLKK